MNEKTHNPASRVWSDFALVTMIAVLAECFAGCASTEVKRATKLNDTITKSVNVLHEIENDIALNEQSLQGSLEKVRLLSKEVETFKEEHAQTSKQFSALSRRLTELDARLDRLSSRPVNDGSYASVPRERIFYIALELRDIGKTDAAAMAFLQSFEYEGITIDGLLSLAFAGECYSRLDRIGCLVWTLETLQANRSIADRKTQTFIDTLAAQLPKGHHAEVERLRKERNSVTVALRQAEQTVADIRERCSVASSKVQAAKQKGASLQSELKVLRRQRDDLLSQLVQYCQRAEQQLSRLERFTSDNDEALAIYTTLGQEVNLARGIVAAHEKD